MKSPPETTPETSAAKPSLWKRIKRDVANNEPTWVWGRRWDCGAGFTKGFGLGFHVRTDEFDVTLGPFSLGGVRNGR